MQLSLASCIALLFAASAAVTAYTGHVLASLGLIGSAVFMAYFSFVDDNDD